MRDFVTTIADRAKRMSFASWTFSVVHFALMGGAAYCLFDGLWHLAIVLFVAACLAHAAWANSEE